MLYIKCLLRKEKQMYLMCKKFSLGNYFNMLAILDSDVNESAILNCDIN